MRRKRLALGAAAMGVMVAVSGCGGPGSTQAASSEIPAASSGAPASPSHGQGLPEEQGFLKENQQAMDTMMSRMATHPTGNVDDDFVAMMTPHHQGAIDMARAELRYGTNEQLRRIAQEIIVTQQQEIVAMYQALGKPLPPAAPAPDQVQSESTSGTPHGN